MESYPVRARVPVERARRFLRTTVEKEKLPKSRAGVTMVLDVHGSFEIVPRGVAITECPGFKEASQIVVVDTSTRRLAVETEVPDREAISVFRVEAEFACRVLEPSEVLQDEIGDVAQLLTTWVSRQLRPCGHRLPTSEAPRLEQVARKRLTRYLGLRPPVRNSIMGIELLNVEVRLPEEQAAYRKTRAELRRSDELASLKSKGLRG